MRAVRPTPTRSPSRPDALLAALLATLEHPGDWVAALTGFLARGGILAFLLPIVVLPTPAGIQVEIAPLLVPFVFGQVSPGLSTLAAIVGGLVVAWLFLGGLVGAWADATLARRVAGAPPDPRPAITFTVVTARLLAHLPLVLALVWGAARIVATTYAELLTPFEVSTPLAIRVIAGAPDAIAAVALAWLLGEAAGGLAVREVVLGGRSALAAAVLGWVGLVGRPIGSVVALVIGTVALVVAVVPAIVAASAAWSQVRVLLYDGGEPAALVLVLAAFVALWLGGLVLAAVATAFRSALWTAEWLRRRGRSVAADRSADASAVGTIGGFGAANPGGWPSSGASGTL
jgi:hypothetical protein